MTYFYFYIYTQTLLKVAFLSIELTRQKRKQQLAYVSLEYGGRLFKLPRTIRNVQVGFLSTDKKYES